MSAHRQAALAKYLFKRNNRSFTRKGKGEGRTKEKKRGGEVCLRVNAGLTWI